MVLRRHINSGSHSLEHARSNVQSTHVMRTFAVFITFFIALATTQDIPYLPDCADNCISELCGGLESYYFGCFCTDADVQRCWKANCSLNELNSVMSSFSDSCGIPIILTIWHIASYTAPASTSAAIVTPTLPAEFEENDAVSTAATHGTLYIQTASTAPMANAASNKVGGFASGFWILLLCIIVGAGLIM